MQNLSIRQSEPINLTNNNQELYSGNSKDGTDHNGSFDRLISTNRNSINNFEQIIQTIEKSLYLFQESPRSRLVIRTLTSCNSNEIINIQNHFPELEINFYPSQNKEFNYLTIVINKANRIIPNQVISEQRILVRDRTQKIINEIADFEEFSIRQLEHGINSGFRLTRDIHAQELHTLWEQFGWSISSCRTLLRNMGQDEIMGLRNEQGTLIATALYSDQSHGVRHGETTEWATLPEYRKQGTISLLLTGLHSMLLDQGIQNIFAELRIPDPKRKSPNSIGPALKSGMDIEEQNYNSLLTNHVTISGTPDTHNQNLENFGKINGQELRTFITANVNPEIITTRIRDAYQQFII